MFDDVLIVDRLLDDKTVTQLNEILDTGRFIDGRYSAGHKTSPTKQNLQLDPVSSVYHEACAAFYAGILSSEFFKEKKLHVKLPHFSKYLPGMKYGRHMDAALMRMGVEPFYPELSMTLFLNEPSSYSGGELVIYTKGGEQRIKGKAGSAVIYPSDLLHEVTLVVSGCRKAAVTWMAGI